MKPLLTVGKPEANHQRHAEEFEVTAVEHVLEAVRGLPVSLSRDFLIAYNQRRDIVMKESHPIKFVRREKGDTWAAALRLANHWTFRRNIFGDDYWLKPMRIHNGAMWPSDIGLLRTGAFALLNPPDPETQSQVMVGDFGRFHGLDAGTARSRLAFYLNATGLSDYSICHGLDVIVIINSKGMKMKPDNGRLIQATHTSTMNWFRRVVFVRDPWDQRNTLKHLFERFLLSMVRNFWGDGITCIAEDSPAKTRQVLESMGFHPSTFPIALGGDWNQDSCGSWLLERMRAENNEDASLTSISLQEQPNTSNSKPSPEPTAPELPDESQPPPFNEENDDRKIEASRTTPRKRRAREESESGEKVKTSTARKRRASDQSKTGQGAEASAARKRRASDTSSSVQSLEASLDSRSQSEMSSGHMFSPCASSRQDNNPRTGAIPKDTKARSAYYSRLSYYRKKDGQQQLSNRRDYLVRTNDLLREEQSRLVILVQQAHALIAAVEANR